MRSHMSPAVTRSDTAKAAENVRIGKVTATPRRRTDAGNAIAEDRTLRAEEAKATHACVAFVVEARSPARRRRRIVIQ